MCEKKECNFTKRQKEWEKQKTEKTPNLEKQNKKSPSFTKQTKKHYKSYSICFDVKKILKALRRALTSLLRKPLTMERTINHKRMGCDGWDQSEKRETNIRLDSSTEFSLLGQMRGL